MSKNKHEKGNYKDIIKIIFKQLLIRNSRKDKQYKENWEDIYEEFVDSSLYELNEDTMFPEPDDILLLNYLKEKYNLPKKLKP